MPQSTEAVMRRFIQEVINEGRYTALPDLVHPDYVYRSPDLELQGADALKDVLTAYRVGLPDLQVSIDDLVAAGDKVAISITLTGTHEGELMGIPATGKQLEVHGMVLSRLEQGRIIEERELLDMLGLFQQLGVVSLPS